MKMKVGSYTSDSGETGAVLSFRPGDNDTYADIRVHVPRKQVWPLIKQLLDNYPQEQEEGYVQLLIDHAERIKEYAKPWDDPDMTSFVTKGVNAAQFGPRLIEFSALLVVAANQLKELLDEINKAFPLGDADDPEGE